MKKHHHFPIPVSANTGNHGTALVEKQIESTINALNKLYIGTDVYDTEVRASHKHARNMLQDRINSGILEAVNGANLIELIAETVEIISACDLEPEKGFVRRIFIE